MGEITAKEIDHYLGGESLQIEYKEDRSGQFPDKKIYESAVALANTGGGVLLIGVTDTGVLKGAHNIGRQWPSPDDVVSIILRNTQPSLLTSVSFVSVQNVKIVFIEIPASSTVVGTTSGKYLKRRLSANGKPENFPMDSVEIASGVHVVGAMDFSSSELQGCSLDDIDMDLAKETFDNLSNRSDNQGDKNFFNQSPKDILKSLALINNTETPNIAGLLLFGKKKSLSYRIPNAFVQYQQFGLKGEILVNERYTEPLVKLMPELIELEGFKRTSDEFLYKGQSTTIPEYSAEAIRETIANALSHRDYTYPNSIQIQLFSDELTVTSPGGLPRGVNIDRLLTASPSPRNRRLSEALYRLKFSEGSGRGVDFIYYGQARYGRPAPDYSMSDNDRVSVRIPGGKANLDFCKLVLSINATLNIQQMFLLNAMFLAKSITLNDAVRVLQISHTQVREILMSMHRMGLIETLDEMNSFFIKASISPFATKVVVPKRLSAGDKKNYKKLIKDVLKRREGQPKEIIADAIGLSAHQCYRLLKELESEGSVCLTKNGRKKWILT